MSKVYFCLETNVVVGSLEEAVKHRRFMCIRLVDYKNRKVYSDYVDSYVPRFKDCLSRYLVDTGFDGLD
jgi:hypothetical protein